MYRETVKLINNHVWVDFIPIYSLPCIEYCNASELDNNYFTVNFIFCTNLLQTSPNLLSTTIIVSLPDGITIYYDRLGKIFYSKSLPQFSQFRVPWKGTSTDAQTVLLLALRLWLNEYNYSTDLQAYSDVI